MRTYVAKGEEAEALKFGAHWFVVDATNQVLGRLATKVARMLIGKDKATFTPYLDSGDHVVVINADKIKLTGNKVEQKVYYSHSGYPGGLKEVPAKRVRETKPGLDDSRSHLGMLPRTSSVLVVPRSCAFIAMQRVWRVTLGRSRNPFRFKVFRAHRSCGVHRDFPTLA